MTTVTTATTGNTIAAAYIAAFNASDPAARRDLIGRTFTEDATYVDPLMSSEGHAAIDAMIDAVQRQFPAHVFRLVTAVDAYADRVRFSWTMGPDGSDTTLLAGTDVGVLSTDGRLRSVTGFIDQMPAGQGGQA